MRINFRDRHLVVTRSDGRVNQYQLPSNKLLINCTLVAMLAYYLLNPMVGNLATLAVIELDPGKMVAAKDRIFNQISNDLENAALVRRPPRRSCLETIRLEVPDNTFLEMQKALKNGSRQLNHEPGGYKPYFKATLLRNGDPVQVKMCLRGTMLWHHRPEKPSFRIKLRKDDVERGDRYIELTTPEDSLVVKNWLPMELANDLELMSDLSSHVRLFVNQKYFGVYVRSTRQGEPFALANQRMPGTFFKAEFSGDMWKTVDAWKTFGQQDEADRQVMQTWLDVLSNPPSGESLERFDAVFDTEKFARWAALMAVVGSIHTDDTHNHSYFFCSNQGKLEAMPLDCNGYGSHTSSVSPVDVQVQPVLRYLSCDPRWVHRRNEWIYQLIQGKGSTPSTTKIINELMSEMNDDLMADRNLGNVKKFEHEGWQWEPKSVFDLSSERNRLSQWICQRNNFLDEYVRDCKFSIKSNSDSCQINVFGSAAVRVQDLDTGVVKVLYPGLSEDSFLFPGDQQPVPLKYLKPVVMEYSFKASSERLEFFNAVTGEPVLAQASPNPTDELLVARTLHVSELAGNPTQDVVLGPGKVVLEEDLIVGPQQRLIVRPGTEICLDAGVGIYSRGQTQFQGTSSQPILVHGSSDLPWAAIGIAGAKTAGSRFEFVDVSGGSIGWLGHLRFKGMFNAYDCPDVTLLNCSIGQNFIGDDAVNLAESKIRVDQCTWRDAKADALDLDMCSGEVSNCQWFNSGNDGLDLMSCVLSVTDCYFEGSGDKGISVGENTRLQAERVRIVDCLVGTEVKDDSVAQYVDSVFERCGTAVHSYQKKWFYSGGGNSALVDCEIVNSDDHDVEMKAKSNILLVRTKVEATAKEALLPRWQKRVQELDTVPQEWKDSMQPLRYRTH